jgi:glycosyltransferase involved in cell wall biosynthesis
MEVIHLGADEDIESVRAADFTKRFGLSDFILEVGRINSRKGQARLIRALKGAGLPLVFIGPLDSADGEGCREFLALAQENREWTHYLGPVYERRLLYGAYHAARVHVLPSIGEFPGLVSLEAALAGAKVVVGAAPEVKEYFGSDAWYCDPRSETDIRSSVLDAWIGDRGIALRERVRTQFTWRRTAERLLEGYEAVFRKGNPAKDA